MQNRLTALPRLRNGLFWITMTLMMVFSATCLALATSWQSKTFPGFMLLGNQCVDSLYRQDWNGIKEGMQVADRIVKVDGIPVTSSAIVYRYIATLPVGTPVTYEIERSLIPGKVEHLVKTVPTQTFRFWDMIGVFGALWLLGFFHLLIGAFVSRAKPDDRVARAHLYFCLVFAAFWMSHFEASSTYNFTILPHTLAFCLVGTFALDLAFQLPRRMPFMDRQPWIRWICFGLGGAVTAYVLSNYYAGERWFFTFLILTIYASLAVIALPLSAAWTYRSRTSTPLERAQALLILWGALLGFMPAILVNLLTFFGISLPGSELAYLGMTLFPLSVAYTIVRHKLFNIDVIVKRTITYTIVTSALLGIYFLMIGGVRLLIGNHSEVANILATAIVALAFAPMRDRTKKLVDKLFFRSDYNFQTIVTEFSDEARVTLDSQQLLCAFIKQVERALYPGSIAVLLRHAGTDELHLKESLGLDPDLKLTLSVDHPAFDLLRRAGKAISAEPEDFAPLKHMLLVPMRDKDDIIGCVLIGPRKSDLDYKEIDRLLLTNLSQQLAVWLKNTYLIGQVAGQERLKRELEIAAEVQAGLLPSNLPSVPGIEIAALSKPALEVGGDFYDIIRVDENRLGILIGDVSGKGVPAALMMAMTLVVFRSLARGDASAASVMSKANELIYLNRPSRKMFVTAFYAIYDTRDRSLCFANAGNPFPIGSLGRLEAKGVSLGVLAKSTYEERRITMRAGELLVLYSDGAEDAMNSEQEQFGEERLEQIVTENLTLSPGEIHARLLSEIRDFTGDGPPFDDITLVTLKTSG